MKNANIIVQPYKPEKKGKKGLTKGGSGDIINKLSDASERKRAKEDTANGKERNKGLQFVH